MKNIKTFITFISESKTLKNIGDYKKLPEQMFTLKQGGLPFWMRKRGDDAIKGIWTAFKLEDRFPGIVGGSEIKTEKNSDGTIEIRTCKNALVDGDPRIYEPADINKGKGLYIEYNTFHENGIDKDTTYFIPYDVKNPYRADKGLKEISSSTNTENSIEYNGKNAIKLKGLFTREHAEVVNQWIDETIAGTDSSKFDLEIPVKYRLSGGSKGPEFSVNVKPLPGEFKRFKGLHIPLESSRNKQYEDKFDDVLSHSLESGKYEIFIDVINNDIGNGSCSISLIFENFPMRWNIPEHSLTKEQAQELKIEFIEGEDNFVDVEHTTFESNYTWTRFAVEDLEKRLKEVEPYFMGNSKISSTEEKDNLQANILKKFKEDEKFRRAKMNIFLKDHKKYVEWLNKHPDSLKDDKLIKYREQNSLFTKLENETDDKVKLEIFTDWFIKNKEENSNWKYYGF